MLTSIYKLKLKYRNHFYNRYHAIETNVYVNFIRTVTKHICEKAKELDTLYNQLKEKLSIPSYNEKVQFLALLPNSWSRQKTSEEFNVSDIKFAISKNKT